MRPALVLATASILLGAGAPAQAYTLGGPGADLQTENASYAWENGSYVAPFRDALENPAYFGPGGVVEEPIDPVDLDPVDAAALVALDGFISPWWYRAESAPYEAAVVDFFLGGGDLWLLQDSGVGFDGVGRDGIGALLGIPTVGQTAITPVSGTAPLFDGPFGTAGAVTQGGGQEGYLSEADVIAAGGTIVARNTEDQVIAAVWRPGQYASGAGALIVVADIDMFTTEASFSPLDDNGIFTLNAFSFLATSTVPEPSAALLLGAALAAAALRGARRH